MIPIVFQCRNGLKTAQQKHCKERMLLGIVLARMTNTVQRERARDRQQHSMSTGSHTPRVKGRRSRSADDVNNVTGSAAPYTRSSTRPLNKDMCFFCQTDNDQKLFSVRTGNAGQSPKQAVQASSGPELKTRYSTCIDDGDAHAMDI